MLPRQKKKGKSENIESPVIVPQYLDLEADINMK